MSSWSERRRNAKSKILSVPEGNQGTCNSTRKGDADPLPLDFSPLNNLPNIETEINPKGEKEATKPEGRNSVFSTEKILGSPFSGGSGPAEGSLVEDKIEEKAILQHAENENIKQIPPPKQPQNMPSVMENPFTEDAEEVTAVVACATTLSNDKEKYPIIGNNSNPQSYALVYTYADFAKKVGCQDVSDRNLNFAQNCLVFEMSKKGKDNRVKMFLEAVKALMQADFQLEKAKSKWLGA